MMMFRESALISFLAYAVVAYAPVAYASFKSFFYDVHLEILNTHTWA
jgi:hypothetical protein